MAKSIRSKTKRFYRSVKRDKMADGEVEKIKARNALLAAAVAAQEPEVQARREAARAEREAVMEAEKPESKAGAAKREEERARMLLSTADDEEFPNGKPYGRNALKRMIKGKKAQKKHARSKSRQPRNFHKATRAGK